MTALQLSTRRSLSSFDLHCITYIDETEKLYLILRAENEGRNIRQSEGKNHRWYLTTVAKSGSDRVIPASNLLSNVWNQSRGAVLAEPFPWTVIQGVILAFIIVNSQL
jgi:hypothetical protein